jgi:hypothetical protein
VYLERGQATFTELPGELRRVGPFPEGLVHGWPDNAPIPVQPMWFSLCDLRLLLVTAAPPGELNAEHLGFPPGSPHDPCRPAGTAGRTDLSRKGERS